MSFAEIIKEQDFFKSLAEKKEKNTLSNAIMFLCEDEMTSKNVLVLTALLMEYQMFELFDEKSAEFLRVLNGADLDVKVYPKNSEKLLVADSNDIVSEAYIKPVNLPNKIFVINNFDISTEEAQNKLLKVLEEPPKNVYFLLSVANESKVLPTIKSRCDKIKINPIAEEKIKEVCHNELACILGRGYLGKTMNLAEREDLQNITSFAVSLFTKMKSSKDVLIFSKQFYDRAADLDLIVEIMSLCIEDMIKIKCESEKLCKLKPFVEEIKDVEPEFSIEALCEIFRLILSLKEKIEFNANLPVALDNFLMKMLEVKYLCK
ncbi:MAG: hypothetical protein IJ817_01295 [Clostridia bacterium]|nr:hypothetical protein [Clostridia bacterium]